jgi:hypothetical protein
MLYIQFPGRLTGYVRVFIMMSFIKEPPGKLDVEHIILKE